MTLEVELAFETSNFAFDTEKEINSISPNRELISMVGCMEEVRIRLVRSHHVLKANGSIVSSRIKLSVLPLEPCVRRPLSRCRTVPHANDRHPASLRNPKMSSLMIVEHIDQTSIIFDFFALCGAQKYHNSS